MSEDGIEEIEEVLEIGGDDTPTFETKFLSGQKDLKIPDKKEEVKATETKGKKKNVFTKKMKFDSKKYRKKGSLAQTSMKEVNGMYINGIGSVLGVDF